jgi:cytochrome c oxidase assembly protein Cox11
MPLLFFIDKDVLEDPACRNLDDIVLSYTFFKWVFIICIAGVLTSRVTQGETECARSTGT